MNNHPQTILITGASSGLGKALALGYANEGVCLYLTARNNQRLNQVATACRAKGALVTTANIEILEKEKLHAWIIECDNNTPLDLVIANAGVSNAGADLSLEDNNQLFDINFQGTLNTIHPIIPKMRERGKGHIAIMSSLAGFRGLARAPAYCAAKAAIRVYGEALSVALLKDNVYLSVICPGFVRTPLTDKNTFKMPFIMSAEKAARIMIKDLSRKKALITYPKLMYFAVWLLAAMPTFIARKISNAMTV